MKGTTYKRTLPSGKITWAYQVDAGKNENGKRIRVSKTGFERKADADTALAKALHDRNEGSFVRPDPRTFAEFVETWLTEYAETSCAPKTSERYGEMLKQHVASAIGAQPLSKVTTLQIQRVYNKLLKEELAIKTVHNIHAAVHIALETAVAWELIKTNPASRCKLPSLPKREAVALDFTDVRQLLEASTGHHHADLLIVNAGCGARRGEQLALIWTDIDLDAATVTIGKSLEQTRAGLRVKQTKGNNIRVVPLPRDAMAALHRVKANQEKLRAMYGDTYRTDLDLVFCQPSGDYLRPDTVGEAVRRIAKKAGFSGVSLHTLRHSYGSQLLSAGVPLPTVSKLLGHGSVYVTAKVYSHALASDEAAAVEKWQAAKDRAAKSKVVRMPTKKSSSAGVATNGNTKRSSA